jgi:hypothetical protein
MLLRLSTLQPERFQEENIRAGGLQLAWQAPRPALERKVIKPPKRPSERGLAASLGLTKA